jgi:hypothetical protein
MSGVLQAHILIDRPGIHYLVDHELSLGPGIKGDPLPERTTYDLVWEYSDLSGRISQVRLAAIAQALDTAIQSITDGYPSPGRVVLDFPETWWSGAFRPRGGEMRYGKIKLYFSEDEQLNILRILSSYRLPISLGNDS